MTYSSEVLADSPVAWWKCDETSGTNLADSSGNTRPLTTTGSWASVASFLGPAIDWNGGRASRADEAALKPTSITVECWVQLTGASGDRGLVVKSTAGTLADGYGLYILSDGHVEFYVNAYNGAGRAVGSKLETARWYHLVGTYDGANVRLYVDGLLAATTAYAVAITHSTAALLLADYPSSPGTFTGYTSNAAIYSTALSAARVLAHYDAAYAAALRAADSSGNGRHGIYTAGCTAYPPPASLAANAAGENPRVDVQRPGLLPASVTAECWAKLLTSAGSYRAPSFSRQDGLTVNPNKGWNFYAVPASDPVAPSTWQAYYGSGTINVWRILAGPAWVVGAWVHLVLTAGPAGGILYVNGVSVATNATAYVAPDGAYTALGNDWPDALDDVAIYSTVLSAARIAAHYAAASAGAYATEVLADSPLGYWRLDDCQGGWVVGSVGRR